MEPLQCLRSGVLGRVEERQETQQDQVRLILNRVGGLVRRPRHLLISQGDHPEPLTIQVICQLSASDVVLGQDLDDLSLDFYPSTQVQHFFDGALADQRVQAGLIFHHHRHPAPHKVKGDFVDLAVLFFRFQAFSQLLVGEDRLVEQVL